MDGSSTIDIAPQPKFENVESPRASEEAAPDNATLQAPEPAPHSTPLSRADTLVSQPEDGARPSTSKTVEGDSSGIDAEKSEKNEKSEKRVTQIVDVDKFIESNYVPKSLRPRYSTLRKISLLILFCVAQFLDIFNNSSLFSAIPFIASDLRMTSDESTWIVSALQLSFAAFLLVVCAVSRAFHDVNLIIGTERSY